MNIELRVPLPLPVLIWTTRKTQKLLHQKLRINYSFKWWGKVISTLLQEVACKKVQWALDLRHFLVDGFKCSKSRDYFTAWATWKLWSNTNWIWTTDIFYQPLVTSRLRHGLGEGKVLVISLVGTFSFLETSLLETSVHVKPLEKFWP